MTVSDDVTRTVGGDGIIEYTNSRGELHRTDGPAVEKPGVFQEWYINGQTHRTDGPALVNARFKSWWFSDHRLIYLPEVGEIEFGFGHLEQKLSRNVVEAAMEYKGFRTRDEFCNWLALDVLGEESLPFFWRDTVSNSLSLFDSVETYLCNLSTLDGLPFSWWYPIVEGERRQ